MLIALGNGEEHRHLNHQEDWLKTAVISENRTLSKTECRWHYHISYNILAKFLRLPKCLNMGINHRFSCQKVCQSY